MFIDLSQVLTFEWIDIVLLALLEGCLNILFLHTLYAQIAESGSHWCTFQSHGANAVVAALLANQIVGMRSVGFIRRYT